MPRMNSTTMAETTKMRVTRRLLRNAGLIRSGVLPAEPDGSTVRDRHVPTVETEPERIEERGVDRRSTRERGPPAQETATRRAARRCDAAPGREQRLFRSAAESNRWLDLFDRHALHRVMMLPRRRQRTLLVPTRGNQE